MRELVARTAIVAAFLLALFAMWMAYVSLAPRPPVQAPVQPLVSTDARPQIASVLDSLLEQDASVLRYTTTHDKTQLEPYLHDRLSFDTKLSGLSKALPPSAPREATAALQDAQTTYHTWLLTVARPLAYVPQTPQQLTPLIQHDKSLTDRMRSDFNILAANGVAAAQPRVSEQPASKPQLFFVSAAVAALGVVLLAILAIAADRERAALKDENTRIAETSGELIGIADFSGRLRYMNSAWTEKLGYSMRDMGSRVFVDLAHPDDRGKTAYELYRLGLNEPVRGFHNRFRARDGSYHWLMWNALPDPKRRLIYFTARDETDQVRVETELTELSYADPLTGLPNRRYFFQQLQRMINLAHRHRLSFAVLWLDLDQLKQINDRMSHAAGDATLKGVAGNISGKLRESDLFARVGGDEFGILTPAIALPRDMDTLANKIVEAAAQPVDVGGVRIRVTASLGIATYPDDGTTANDLLAAADRAMYSAKRSGGDNFARAMPEPKESPTEVQETPPSA